MNAKTRRFRRHRRNVRKFVLKLVPSKYWGLRMRRVSPIPDDFGNHP
jgi:hypothetical protein